MELSTAILSRVDEFSENGFSPNRHRTPGMEKPVQNGKFSPNSEKAYRNHIRQLEEYLHTKSKNACNATEEDIKAYVTKIQEKLSHNTVAVRVGAIKSYFNWLKRKGQITHIPTIKSTVHAPIQRVEVTENDISELLKQIPPNNLRSLRDAAMITLMAYRGFSTQEVVDMNVEDANFQMNRIKHRGEWHPMAGACEYLIKYVQAKLEKLTQKDEDPFFLNKVGKRISARSLRRLFDAYLEEANLTGKFTTRDLHMSKSKNAPRIPHLVTG